MTTVTPRLTLEPRTTVSEPIETSIVTSDDNAISTRWPKMFIALSDPTFRYYVVGMLSASMPMTMKSVAQGYLAYALTGSATALGIVTLAWGVPQMFAMLFAGVIADRYERRRILMFTQSFSAVMTVATAILIHLNVVEVWHLAVISLLHGTAFAFNVPARQGMAPDLVGDRLLPNAIALNNTAFSLCRIMGPALAGALIAVPFINVAGTYDLMALSYLIAVVVLWRLKFKRNSRPRASGKMVDEIRSAFSYAGRTPILASLLLVGFVPMMLGMPFQMLLPVFAATIHNVGPAGMGAMLSMVGIGALVGSLGVAALAESNRKGIWQLFGAFGMGLAILGFAFNTDYLVALVLLFLVGALSQFYQSINNTLIMLNTDRAFLGRVMSINMLGMSFNPVFTLPVSGAVDLFGAEITIAFLGTGVTLFALAIAVLDPRRRAV